MNVSLLLLLVLALLSASSRSLAAQFTPPQERVTESSAPRLKQWCAAAVEAMQTNDLTTLVRANAAMVRDLGQCDESAGAVLPNAWRAARADSSVLDALMMASTAVRDRRIELALIEVAADSARPDVVRGAAIAVLTSYARSHVSASVRRSVIPGVDWEIGISFVSHARHQDGVERLRPRMRERVLELLGRLEEEERPRVARRALASQATLHRLIKTAIAIVEATQADQPAMFMSGNAAVDYPQVLQAANVEGEVLIDLRVDSLGRLDPGSLRVLASDHELFTRAVTVAVRGWTWGPAVRDGRRAAEEKQYRFTFHISARGRRPCPSSTVEHQVICAELSREEHSAYGIFRGYHTTGFEEGSFVLCPDRLPSLPPELERAREGARVWATFTREASRSHPPIPRGATRDAWGATTYFVVGRGTLKGPGSYGHLGVSEFVVVIDTVLAVHPPRADACARFPAY